MSTNKKISKSEKLKNEIAIVDEGMVRERIHVIRGVQVMLNFELAEIYGFTTSSFNQQVKRNIERFDDDFRFQLSKEEFEKLSISQNVISIQTKPGFTAILKHLLPLSPSTTWLGEYYDTDYNLWFLDPMEYTGSIYYLIYQTDHSYELQYTGNNYHSGYYHYYEKAHVCTNCGASYGAYYEKRLCSGPPCPNVIGKHFDEIE